MEVKEAIDEVYQVFYVKYGKFGNQKADDIIDLLQQGEKYKQMWEELNKGNYALIEFDDEVYKKEGTKSFTDIEQKYFPKEKVIK